MEIIRFFMEYRHIPHGAELFFAYVCNGNGNILHSIDISCKKEYNYV